MQNQEKIIKAIQRHLKLNAEIIAASVKHGNTLSPAAAIFHNCIAPHLEAGAEPKDYPYTELFDHMANEHGLTLTNTELGDIIHVVKAEKNER